MNRQKFYDQMIAKGVAPRLAEMLACQSPPAAHGTDKSFLEGTGTNPVPGVPDFMRDKYLEQAHEAGINVNGKVYKSSLSDLRQGGDPEAWVSGRDDVKRVLRKRNKNCWGAVKHEAIDMPPAAAIRLDPELVDVGVREILAKEPGVKKSRKAIRELRERVVEQHGAKV